MDRPTAVENDAGLAKIASRTGRERIGKKEMMRCKEIQTTREVVFVVFLLYLCSPSVPILAFLIHKLYYALRYTLCPRRKAKRHIIWNGRRIYHRFLNQF